MSAPEPQVRVDEVRPGLWRARCDSCGRCSLTTPSLDDAESGAEAHRQHCPDLRLARLQARWDARNEAEHALIEKWRNTEARETDPYPVYIAEAPQCADELERAIGDGES